MKKIFVFFFVLTVSMAAQSEWSNSAEIVKTLKAQFDRPDNPVRVEAVVSSSEFGIASWTQGSNGGRALLKRQGGSWNVLLCAGKSLKEVKTLVQADVPAEVSKKMLAELNLLEMRLPEGRRHQFDDFSMGQSAHH